MMSRNPGPRAVRKRRPGKTRASDSRHLTIGVDRKKRPIHRPMRLLPYRPEALELVPWRGPSISELMGHTMAELRKLAKSEGLKKYSSLDKASLAKSIHTHARQSSRLSRRGGDR